MAEGRSLEGCAALLGVHPDSLNEWQKVHPQFFRGRARRQGSGHDLLAETGFLPCQMANLSTPKPSSGR